jgi:hypothetical protein
MSNNGSSSSHTRYVIVCVGNTIYVIGAHPPSYLGRTKRILIDIAITAIVKNVYRVEHADVSLRIINERLMEENAQLQEQVREYERWMEFIMTKFRLQNVRCCSFYRVILLLFFLYFCDLSHGPSFVYVHTRGMLFIIITRGKLLMQSLPSFHA